MTTGRINQVTRVMELSWGSRGRALQLCSQSRVKFCNAEFFNFSNTTAKSCSTTNKTSSPAMNDAPISARIRRTETEAYQESSERQLRAFDICCQRRQPPMPHARRSRSQRQRESARFLKASQLKRLSELDSDSRRRLLLQSPDRSLSPLHRSYDPVTELPIFTCRYLWFIQLCRLNSTFLRPLPAKNFAKFQLRHRFKSVAFLNFFFN